MLDTLTTLSVLKLLRFTFVSLSQPANMLLIPTTFFVSKLPRSKLVSLSQL